MNPTLPAPARSRALESALAAAVLSVAAIAAYVPTLDGYFVGDDFGLIRVLHDKPLRHFFSLFTGSWTDDAYGVRPDELRPFIALAYQLDALRGPASPPAYHAGSIAYHVACTLLVFALARVAARAGWATALGGSLFFAWHASHAEAVGWISGRADSIPTLFYLAALLAYAAWRSRPRAWLLASSAALGFCALFSKQSAITLPLMLLAYEALVEGRRGRPLARWIGPIAPFAALTVGYLVLRQVLFGNFVREQLLSFERLRRFLIRQPAYADALFSPAVVTSEEVTARGLAVLALAVAGSLLLARAAWRATPRDRGLRAAVFFGPVWYVVTVAPLLVTYFTPRHLYLASAGLPIALAAIAERLAAGRGRAWRIACAAAGLVLLGAHVAVLQVNNRHWTDAGVQSRALAIEAQRAARSAPEGSLVVIDAPWRTRHTYVWAWAVPFVMQPPFTERDLTRRVHVVSHSTVYCCPQDAWLADLRQQTSDWLRRSTPAVVVCPGRHDREATAVAEDRVPGLRHALGAAAGAATPAAAQARLQHAVALARQAVRPTD